MVDVSPEVRVALDEGRPVVALESTLIAHGLPWPDSLETARDAEAAVRRSGAVPATIALLGGRIRAGLGDDDLERLARPGGPILKASRRDLAGVMAQGLDAATTVSSTLWIAGRVGINVMATGGLGGVHRDAGRTFDVSADLDQLARQDGALLVCSGIKSILDMPATLEALETRGVPVIGYGTNALPAFTTVSSGLALDWRVDSPAEAADFVRMHRCLGLPGAILLVQPVPASVAIERETLESAIAAGTAQATQAGITGKALTPFLLDAVRRETGGRSLPANRALIIANAALAGAVASALVERATTIRSYHDSVSP
jgi:pseudouridine-5'-phosphate glycosidase